MQGFYQDAIPPREIKKKKEKKIISNWGGGGVQPRNLKFGIGINGKMTHA